MFKLLLFVISQGHGKEEERGREGFPETLEETPTGLGI